MISVRHIALLTLLFAFSLGKLMSQRPQISSGHAHTLYLCPEGDIYSWGDNQYGQLGWGEIGESYSSIGKISSLQNITKAVAALGLYSFAIRKDSSLWAWGQNNFGQLGNDDYCGDPASESCIQNILPLRVEGGETGDKYLQNVVNAAGGLTHSYALLSSGEVVSWGDNSSGELGNGNKTDYRNPRYVRTSTSNRLVHIKQIAAGAYFGIALDSSGRVWAWGDNEKYKLGIGTSGNKSFATPVVNINGYQLSSIVKIAAGQNHALFLDASGMVYATGLYQGIAVGVNPVRYAQLVAGGATGAPLLNHIVDISAGMVHSLALQQLPSGARYLLSWGYNKFYRPIDRQGGQLGLGSSLDTNRQAPAYALLNSNDTARNVIWMQAGSANSFAYIYDPGSGQSFLYGCGSNTYYQLGFNDGFNYYRLTPLSLPDCRYNCSIAYLGKDVQYCQPFQVTLRSGSVSDQNSYRWYRNDTLLNDTTSSIKTSKSGSYVVKIDRRTYHCATSTDTVSVETKAVPFRIFNRSFCGDTLLLSAWGTGHFAWWNAAEYGKQLSSTYTLRCAVRDAYVAREDSVVVWLQSESCQRLPVGVRRRCQCEVSPPLLRDTAVCQYSRFIRLAYDSVVWYSNARRDTIVGIGSTDVPLNKQPKTIWGSYFTNTCESDLVPLKIDITPCTMQYQIEGSISPNIAARIYLFDASLPSVAIDSAEVDNAGMFHFISEKGRKTVLAVPYDTSNYKPTWFYRAASAQHANTIQLVANAREVKIALLSQPTNGAIATKAVSFIAPNPATTQTRVTLSSKEQIVRIRLLSQLGQIYSPAFEQQDATVFFNVSQLPIGVYQVLLESESGVQIGRIVRQ